MSYFTKFPKIGYTLDEYRSAQVIPDVLRRAKFIQTLQDNFAFFDEYDVVDGETPEIVADQVYNDPQLHWVVLLANEIIDPRFDWPLDTYHLARFVEGKYGNVNAIHHYEDSTGNITNGNVIVVSSAEFTSFGVDDVIVNSSNSGTAFITAKANTSSITITTTNGGFQTGDVIQLASNANIKANITVTSIISGTAVTNYGFESEQNENKRRIKLLKPQVVADVVNEFESVIKR